MLTQESACQYVVVRYVPDDVRSEPINIGIIAQSPKEGRIDQRFVTRFSRLSNRVPDANVELVRTFIKMVTEGLESHRTDPTFLSTLESSSHHQFQYSAVRGLLTESFDEEVEQLFDRFVSIERPREKKESVSRESVKKTLRQEIARFKLTPLVEESYMVEGQQDEFVFDFAFGMKSPKTEWRPASLTHALSLDIAEDLAMDEVKVLAFSIEDARATTRLRKTSFTVVLQPPPPESAERLRSAPKILESVGAGICWRSDVPSFVRGLQDTLVWRQEPAGA